MFNAASFAAKACDKAHGCNNNEHTPCLQKKIMKYFDEEIDPDMSTQMKQSRLVTNYEVHRIPDL